MSIKVKDTYVRNENGQIVKTPFIEGVSAYDSAVIGGYSKTETQFYQDLGKLENINSKAEIDDEETSNAKVWSSGKTFNELNSLKSELVSVDDFDERTLVESWTELTVTTSDGFIKKTNGNIETSYSGYKYTFINVTSGEQYKVSGSVSASGYNLVSYFNDNVFVSSEYGRIDNTKTDYVDQLITIPENITKLGVTSKSDTSIVIKKKGGVNVATKVESISTEVINLDEVQKEHEIIVSSTEDRIITEQKRNPFAWKTFDKGIISFVVDDTKNDIDLLADIFEEYGYKVCLSAIPSCLSNVTTATGSGETVKEVMQRVVENGGEILTHGANALSATSTDKEVYDAIVGNKLELLKNGFNTYGYIEIGSGGDEKNFNATRAEKYLRVHYDYANAFGSSDRLNLPQFNIGNGRKYISRTISDNHTRVDNAISQKTWVIFATHSITSTDTSSTNTSEAILRDLLSYCQTNNVTVMTCKEVFDAYGSTVLENRILALENA